MMTEQQFAHLKRFWQDQPVEDDLLCQRLTFIRKRHGHKTNLPLIALAILVLGGAWIWNSVHRRSLKNRVKA